MLEVYRKGYGVDDTRFMTPAIAKKYIAAGMTPKIHMMELMAGTEYTNRWGKPDSRAGTMPPQYAKFILDALESGDYRWLNEYHVCIRGDQYVSVYFLGLPLTPAPS